MKFRVALTMLAVIVVPLPSLAGTCVISRIQFPVRCRVKVNGQPHDKIAHLNLNPQSNPDWGTVVQFGVPNQIPPCITIKTNCSGTNYFYSVVDINRQWTDAVMVGGTAVPVSRSDNEAYWDYYYRGYTQQSGIDYTQNCHGYAFGVGSWPDDSQYGALTLLNKGVCYVSASNQDATLAITPGGKHSMKVSGSKCNDGETTNWIIGSSSEKCLESGIYTLSGNCSTGSVDLGKAHRRAHPTLNIHFDLYKKKP